LVRYTSELRDKNGNFFAFVDFNADDNEGRIRECPHCEKYGFQNKLAPKILKKGQQRTPDDDQFVSCYECGNTFGIHETHLESKIKDSVETTDNHFNNETTFLSTDNRATQRRKNKGRRRSKRFRQEEKIDKDISSEKGIVNILYDFGQLRPKIN
jgi:hypothetical protein